MKYMLKINKNNTEKQRNNEEIAKVFEK